eukprot:752751-Hanusia_phi.AAC.1
MESRGDKSSGTCATSTPRDPSPLRTSIRTSLPRYKRVMEADGADVDAGDQAAAGAPKVPGTRAIRHESCSATFIPECETACFFVPCRPQPPCQTLCFLFVHSNCSLQSTTPRLRQLENQLMGDHDLDMPPALERSSSVLTAKNLLQLQLESKYNKRNHDESGQAVEKLSNLFRNEIEAFHAEFSMCRMLPMLPKNMKMNPVEERKMSGQDDGGLRSSTSDEFSDCLSP